MCFGYIGYAENMFSDEIGSYSSYGIQCLDTEQGENGSILAELSDVSKDYSFVKWAAGRFTEFQLNPEHIEDAIENAYIEYYEIL